MKKIISVIVAVLLTVSLFGTSHVGDSRNENGVDSLLQQAGCTVERVAL